NDTERGGAARHCHRGAAPLFSLSFRGRAAEPGIQGQRHDLTPAVHRLGTLPLALDSRVRGNDTEEGRGAAPLPFAPHRKRAGPEGPAQVFAACEGKGTRGAGAHGRRPNDLWPVARTLVIGPPARSSASCRDNIAN